MRSENTTLTESANTTGKKSRKNGRMIATAALAAGVALVAAGGFAGVVNPWNMGTLAVGTWKSNNLPDKVSAATVTPGAYTMSADNQWAGGKKAKLTVTNADTTQDYVVKLDQLKTLWFDNLNAGQPAKDALKKHTKLSAWDGNNQMDTNGVVSVSRATDGKTPTTVAMEFWMSLPDAKAASNDVAKELEPLKNTKIDKTDIDPAKVVVKK